MEIHFLTPYRHLTLWRQSVGLGAGVAAGNRRFGA
jgi:hypothetical protein